jgi:hypothetical protein
VTEPIEPKELVSRLARQMPEGIRVLDAVHLTSRSGTIPRKVVYDATLNGFDHGAVAETAARLMRFEPIHFDRFVHKQSTHVRIDLRPYIDSIRVDDNRVSFTLYVTGGGSIRPAEICRALGIGGEHVNHRISRRQVTWH